MKVKWKMKELLHLHSSILVHFIDAQSSLPGTILFARPANTVIGPMQMTSRAEIFVTNSILKSHWFSSYWSYHNSHDFWNTYLVKGERNWIYFNLTCNLTIPFFISNHSNILLMKKLIGFSSCWIRNFILFSHD